jgi:hypothetical protein
MTFDCHDSAGFAPRRDERAEDCRSTVLAQLITSVALVLSIAVAATAVSIGIARADGLAATAADPNANIAVAILLGLVLLGTSGLTVFGSRSRARVARVKTRD